MIGVDIFAGAGGMSLGAKWAGVDVHFAVESDTHAAATYSLNHPGTEIFVGDIRNLPQISIPRNDDLVLFGGPPCQGFSTSNQRTRTKLNKTNWLFREFIRFLDQLKPQWFVFENVKGLIETEGGMFYEEILAEFTNAGYECSSFVLHASDYGVPQIRSRLFVIGSSQGVKIECPPKIVDRPITVNEAISDLPVLENGALISQVPYRCIPKSKYAKKMRNGIEMSSNHLVTRNAPLVIERYKHVPEGGNWENIPLELMGNYKDRTRCHTGIYRRLVDSKPSVVLGNYRKNMLIHPTENRGLSVREAARIQSFPDNYEFKGSIGFQQQQVGNAVPPLLSKAVFDQIIKNV